MKSWLLIWINRRKRFQKSWFKCRGGQTVSCKMEGPQLQRNDLVIIEKHECNWEDLVI